VFLPYCVLHFLYFPIFYLEYTKLYGIFRSIIYGIEISQLVRGVIFFLSLVGCLITVCKSSVVWSFPFKQIGI